MGKPRLKFLSEEKNKKKKQRSLGEEKCRGSSCEECVKVTPSRYMGHKHLYEKSDKAAWTTEEWRCHQFKVQEQHLHSLQGCWVFRNCWLSPESFCLRKSYILSVIVRSPPLQTCSQWRTPLTFFFKSLVAVRRKSLCKSEVDPQFCKECLGPKICSFWLDCANRRSVVEGQ